MPESYTSPLHNSTDYQNQQCGSCLSYGWNNKPHQTGQGLRTTGYQNPWAGLQTDISPLKAALPASQAFETAHHTQLHIPFGTGQTLLCILHCLLHGIISHWAHRFPFLSPPDTGPVHLAYEMASMQFPNNLSNDDNRCWPPFWSLNLLQWERLPFLHIPNPWLHKFPEDNGF